MRLIALLTVALLAAGVSHNASAEDTNTYKMFSYRGWMETCYTDYRDQLSAKGEVTDEDIALMAVQCQCEFSRLPAEGQPLDMTQVRAATASCNAEFDADSQAFGQKYVDQLKARGVIGK